MSAMFAAMDRGLSHRSPAQIVAIASWGVVLIGYLDYVTGYEVSIALFYLAPLAAAAWYAGRGAAVGISMLACICSVVTDIVTGHPYSHSAIPIWEAFVRLFFFLMSGLLLVALRDALLRERSLARTDTLTGLLTRRAFEERLQHDLDLARRRQEALTLAYVDLDDFKAVNDTYGHAEGDRTLRKTALALKEVTREVDTVARLGGDEFALVLPDTDSDGAEAFISKLERHLGQPLGGAIAVVGCSIGVVTFQEIPSGIEEALRVADALLYDAKRRGKNTVAFAVVAAGMR